MKILTEYFLIFPRLYRGTTTPCSPSYTFILDFMEPSKVRESFKSFSPLKSSGLDGFKPVVLQQLENAIISYISKLCKIILNTRYTPRSWREMKVSYLPKPGKSDISTARS